MFSLTEQTATLKNWNARAELNGEKRVPASDMIVGVAMNSAVLSEFDSALRHAIYRAPHPGEADLAEQGGEPDEPTRLRFPKMKNSIKWEHQIIGATVTVHYGTQREGSNIVLGECKVDTFVFDPHEGGTVHVGFRIQCHPSAEQAGKLYELNGQEITLSIAPPEADQGTLV